MGEQDSERGNRVKHELAQVATDARARVDSTRQRVADTQRIADETTGKLAQRWNRRVQLMRNRSDAGSADWRNDQLTDGQ